MVAAHGYFGAVVHAQRLAVGRVQMHHGAERHIFHARRQREEIAAVVEHRAADERQRSLRGRHIGLLGAGIGRFRQQVAIVDRAPLQALVAQRVPQHLGIVGRRLGDLRRDGLRVGVAPLGIEERSQVVENHPVGRGLALRIAQRLGRALHATLQVRKGAILLGPAYRGQHHVSLGRGLGQEQLLHDEEIELVQLVGPGRPFAGRVGAHDVERLDRVAGAVEHLLVALAGVHG